MKFHRIALRDYRAIRSVTIEPLGEGITIIQGDNEVGKSSIAEALWLVFEQHDDSASQAVRAIRPAGRDAATEIEVEVSTGPYRFSYSKRFHRGARTELHVHEPRREELTGREAHNRALAILDETIDRELWQALRLQQGASLEPLVAGQHQSLLSALDHAAGQLLGGDRDQTLFERIRGEYERYHTATGRERTSKDGPDVAKLRRRRDDAGEDSRRIAARIASLEERALRASALDVQIEETARHLEAALSRQAELADGEAARRAQLATVETLGSELRACEAALREATSASEARSRLEAGIASRTAELTELTAHADAAAAPLAEAITAAEVARAALEQAEVLLASARKVRDQAEEALHIASAEFTAQTMAERLARLETNEPERARVDEWLRDCRIDGSRLAMIERAQDRLTRVTAKRDAEGASVEIAAAEGLEFEINGKPARVEPGRVARGTVLGESTISLPGGITIKVRAGTRARELEAEIAAAQGDFDALLQAAAVDSADAANALMRERAAAEERRKGIAALMAADLRDLASIDELRQKLQRERVRIDGLGAAGEPLSIADAKAARELADTAYIAAEATLKSAREASERAAAVVVRLEGDRDRFGERSGALAEELVRLETELAAARAELADDALALALKDADTEASRAREQLVEAQRTLDSMPDRSAEATAVAADAHRLEAGSRELSHERASIQGVLEEAGAEGLQQRLVEAEQELAAAEEELESFLKRANAARALFESMRRRRDEARGNYAGPLREKIESLGKLVFGPSFAVELSDDLRIARRTLHGTTLDIAQLSAGVREQLSVLTRLACASLVSSKGGAPLVLDDIFGWADPGRLKKLGPILAQAASDSQVLLFTCTPGRFEAVSPARVVTLPSGAVEERRGVAPVAERRGGAASAEPVAPTAAHPARPLPASPQPQAAFDLFSEGEPAETGEPAAIRR